ncbi:MAG: sulfurtransferase [Chloroflexi bacterium]|nr:sulfurtransferase [Chloroflexota bacterium]
MSLVSTAWLADHLDDPNVRIVDTRWYLLDTQKGERDYFDGHIPNALYLSVDRDLSASPLPDAKTGRHPLPSPEAFAETMARAGVSNTTHVVAYDDAGGGNAARVWWLLRYFSSGTALGHENASLLDGGLNQWLAEERALSTHVPTFPRAQFHARPNPNMFVTKQYMIEHTHDPRTLILDARAPERYRGETEPVDARAGHIPGAKNAPWSENLRSAQDFRFQDANALRARFDALGANGAAEIVAYCGSGINAAAELFALELAGYKNTLLYAASFSEWSRDATLLIVTGAEPF